VARKPDTLSATSALYTRVYHSNTGVLDSVTQQTPGLFFAGSSSIAAARNGVVHLVWVDTRSGTQQIWTKAVRARIGWTPDEQVVFSSTAPRRLPSRPDYNSHDGTWSGRTREAVTTTFFYKEYVPGTGWDPIDTQVTLNTASRSSPTWTPTRATNVYMVWTDSRNGASNPDIYYDTRKNGTWAGNLSIVGAGTDTTNSVQRFPGIVHDEFGVALRRLDGRASPGVSGQEPRRLVQDRPRCRDGRSDPG